MFDIWIFQFELYVKKLGFGSVLYKLTRDCIGEISIIPNWVSWWRVADAQDDELL